MEHRNPRARRSAVPGWGIAALGASLAGPAHADAPKPAAGNPHPDQPSARAICSAARVAIAMIVTCGLTPSEVGTAAPSTT